MMKQFPLAVVLLIATVAISKTKEQERFTAALGLGKQWATVVAQTQNARKQPAIAGIPWDSYNTDDFQGIPKVRSRCPAFFAVESGIVTTTALHPASRADGQALFSHLKGLFGEPHDSNKGMISAYSWSFPDVTITVHDFSGIKNQPEEAMWDFEFALKK